MSRLGVIALAAFAATVVIALGCATPADTDSLRDPAAPAPIANREPLDIVDRSIAFHGGDQLEKSEVALTVTSLSGSFQVRVRAGDIFEYEVRRERDGKIEITRDTNDGVTRSLGGEVVPLDEEEQASARNFVSSRIYFLFLPYRLNDPSAYREDLGVEDWEGRRLHKVRVSFEPGSSASASSEFLYWFDPETDRLEQFAYNFSGGLRFRRLFDFRRIGGILFRDDENYALDGEQFDVNLVTPEFVRDEMKLLSTIQLTDIEVRGR